MRPWDRINFKTPFLCVLISLGLLFGAGVAPRPPAPSAAGRATLIFKSDDGGATWQPADTGIALAHEVRAIALDPSSSQTLYAGTNYGVFKSTSGGNDWNIPSG